MSTVPISNKAIHQGHNIKRFREMMGIKQEALAMELGDDWNQKKVSRLEEKEIVEADILRQVAAILKVPEDVIKNFDEENAIFNIQHNYEGSNIGANNALNSTFSFNPINKLFELFEENKKLYERLLASEREKLDFFKDAIANKK